MAEFNQLTDCATADVITGVSENCQWDVGAPAKLILEDVDHSFATITAAKDESGWGTAIQAKELLPLPLVEEFDDNSEEDTYWTSPINSLDKFIREGKTKFKFRIAYDPCLYKRLRGLNGSKQRLIMSDINNNVIGTSPDDTKFQGVELEVIQVEKWVHSTGDAPSWIPLHVVIKSNIERNDKVAIYQVDWDIMGLNGVQPATLTEVGTSSATEIVVNIATSCDGVAISGITENTDFIFLESDGTTEEPITGVAESATISGQYTLSGAAFTTGGTLNLKDAIDVGTQYYQGTAITITF